jgi:hypothetical protein
MEAVEKKLRLADLRSRDQMTATITDIEDTTSNGTDIVELTYTLSGSGLEVEQSEEFPVPESDTDEYEFVRLCRELHIPLESAHEDIVDKTVTVTWEGSDWQIRLPEEETEKTNSQNRDLISVGISTGLVVGFGLIFPLVSPFLFLHFWSRKGFAVGLAVLLAGLGAWILSAYAVVGP